MANNANNNNQAPAGTGVANFKVPRPWETNVPKFLTEDKDDLRDFIEQVDDIIALAQITDDQEKKRLLTSYLPAKKREIWRALAEYAAASSYDAFKTAVLKAYPEVKEDLNGTLEELERLCAQNRNIKRSEEGRLKRFGMSYLALVTKLTKPPAIILNKEACRKYMEALERSFAETLRTAISTRSLIKEDLIQAGAAPAPVAAGAVDHRKEDPILLKDLVKMAERLANESSTDVPLDEEGIEIKRSDRFPTVKIERRDARLDELSGELSGLRDALVVSQKQSKAAHEELLKAFQTTKTIVANRDEDEAPNRSGGGNSFNPDRQFGRGYGGFSGQNGFGTQRNGCYYCDGQDHFSKECKLKASHIHKGWLTVEDGQQKLADGHFIPRGKGSAATRVEEYWQKKSGPSQFMNADVSYGGSAEDEFDMLRDEVRTLRVKLNEVASGQRTNATAPVAQLQVRTQPYVNQAEPTQAVNMEEFGRTVFNMIKLGNTAQEQFVNTRSKTRGVTFAEPEEQQGF